MSDCDVLVIGGGINGTAIARDAAARGLSVMLVEQGDLAQGTSSASTKLIHGGLRYLEYGDFRLVREGLSEREVMLRCAPHIIRRMRFILPHAHHVRPWWMVRLGLRLYDLLGWGSSLPRSGSLRLAGAGPYGEPLHPDIMRGFSYWDAAVDDARLVVLNARAAEADGATIHTRTRLLSAEREAALWRAEIEDFGGERRAVMASMLVNAAGPWIAGIAGAAPRTPPRLVKGSHIVVPRLFAGDHAYLLQQPDRRIVFAIPYQGDFTLIGTTDIPFGGPPASAAISAEETAYLCAAANRYFTTPVDPSDVIWSFAGIRALADDGATQARAVTREYRLERSAPGDDAPLLCVIGGKITTARALAATAVDMLTGRKADVTRDRPLPGATADVAALAATAPPLPGEDTALRLARAYGSDLPEILADRAGLAEDFGAGLTRAEVDWLRRREWARTAEDVLWRRTKLGLRLSADQAARLEDYMREGA